MKHTPFLPVAAVCVLAASFLFTPALAEEIRRLEVATIGKADNTGRRLRIMRLYTWRTVTAPQTGAEGAPTQGGDARSCRRHQEPAHTPLQNTAYNHIPSDDISNCRLYKPAVR